MKYKIYRLVTSFWFAIQALFMFYWPIYLYYQDGVKFYELSALGCILLLASTLIAVNKKPIIKTAIYILLIYSIFVAIIGTLSIMVASPKIWLAWVTLFIIVSNLVLTLYHCWYSYFKF